MLQLIRTTSKTEVTDSSPKLEQCVSRFFSNLGLKEDKDKVSFSQLLEIIQLEPLVVESFSVDLFAAAVSATSEKGESDDKYEISSTTTEDEDPLTSASDRSIEKTKAMAQERIVNRLSLMLDPKSVSQSCEFYEAVDIASSPCISKQGDRNSGLTKSQLSDNSTPLSMLDDDDDDDLDGSSIVGESSDSDSSRNSSYYEGINSIYSEMAQPQRDASAAGLRAAFNMEDGPDAESFKTTGQTTVMFVPPVLEEMITDADVDENGVPRRKSKFIVLHEPKSSRSRLKQPLLNPVDVEDEDDISHPSLSSVRSNGRPGSQVIMGSMSIAPIKDEFGNKQGSIGHEELNTRKCPLWCCF